MDRIAKFFCSLRLTVVLLCAGLVLVFVGTLAQVHEGLFAAQARYFKSWLIWRPTIGDSTWPIVLPGGYLIGTMLLLNLVAAHIKRFQLTTKKIGIQLIHGGIIILLLGQLLTDVFSQESSMRLSEGMSRNYSEDFKDNELVLVDTSDPKSDRVVSVPEALLSHAGDIHNDKLPVAIRVHHYWQNCDVEGMPPPMAAPVLADHGVFTNFSVIAAPESAGDSDQLRAAVLVEVLSPKGSLGTFFVPGRTEEEQTFTVGDKDWMLAFTFAPMLGGNILAVARAGDMGGESTITFPEADLMSKTELKRDGLLFTLRVKQYWPKCQIFRRPGPNAVQPQVTQGSLAGTFVTPLAPVTDSENRNLPGVVVELLDGKGSLGTWLLWTAPLSSGRSGDELTIDGKPYRLAFQFRRHYEPYSIGLLKFSHDNYKGTDTPRNFASRIRLINPRDNEDREVLIKMNSPLRYQGITYYQASFDKRDDHVTILEVVRNPSWLTPYFACVAVALGLIIQFMSHLIGFARKRKTA